LFQERNVRIRIRILPVVRGLRYARWWVICGFSSAFGSAFYPLFNPQIRMSADPHFTRSHAEGL